MNTFDIDAQTAVELPDRHVMSPVVLVVVNANGNVINVLSFNNIAAAINACGQQIGGSVLGIGGNGQYVTCKAGSGALGL